MGSEGEHWSGQDKRVPAQGVPSPGAHGEDGHERPLQEANEDITPVVLVVRHAGVANVECEGQQEELHRGPQEPRPLPAEPRLHVQLGGQRAAISLGAGWAHPTPRAQMGALGPGTRSQKARGLHTCQPNNPSPPPPTPSTEGKLRPREGSDLASPTSQS